MKDWNGRCHRCKKETNMHIMSMYNTQLICMPCKDKEEKHDDYAEARDAEHEQVKAGNYNFKGIGRKR